MVRFTTIAAAGLSMFLGSLLLSQSTTENPEIVPSRLIGEVTSTDVERGRVTVKTDKGEMVNVGIDGSTRCMRVPPGEKSLANAVSTTIAEINAGDRVLARFSAFRNGPTIPVSLLLVMPRGDLEEKRRQELKDWQTRGVVGRIAAVDTLTRQIQLVTKSLRETKTTTVVVRDDTGIRRYASGSIRFQDASTSSFEKLRVGDQLWVLGKREGNPGAVKIEAEHLVAGMFRNFAATVKAVQASEGKVKVKDLETGKTFSVHVVKDSELRRLPTRMAWVLGMFLKQSAAGKEEPSSDSQRSQPRREERTSGSSGANRRFGPDATSGSRPNMSFQQILQRAPLLSLEELKIGEPLIVSSTTGEDDTPMRAITLVAGVEPLLAASPGGLGPLGGPWSMGISVPQ